MADERGKVNVAILAMPEIAASTVIGMVDLFASVGRDWPFLVNGTFGEAHMRPYIVSARPEGFRAANNVWVKPDFTLEECPAPAIVCVPDLFIAPGESCAGRYKREVAWLRKCHRAGATLASTCSGTLLLAEAGLLDGLDATTHWAYGDALGA